MTPPFELPGYYEVVSIGRIGYARSHGHFRTLDRARRCAQAGTMATSGEEVWLVRHPDHEGWLDPWGDDGS